MRSSPYKVYFQDTQKMSSNCLVLILLGLMVPCISAYLPSPTMKLVPRKSYRKAYRLSAFTDVASSYLAVAADYAAEVQETVGEEVYVPIFRAGLLLTLSGFAASFVAAFLITRTNSWDLLEDEFNEGRESIIEREMAQSDVGTMYEKKSEVKADVVTRGSVPLQQTAAADDDLDDLDI